MTVLGITAFERYDKIVQVVGVGRSLRIQMQSHTEALNFRTRASSRIPSNDTVSCRHASFFRGQRWRGEDSPSNLSTLLPRGNMSSQSTASLLQAMTIYRQF